YEQVFVYKNNRLIAKGDVMILDENFAVKIKDLC
ncbi:MAG: FliM/FliN family flagellar motor switch protein, partial [Treponema sp.]|nr:FliM/FliN family flagellar motor switch protein [Treponema sp.]